MTLIQAIILGIIQGLTEFIPISSSGHLILAQKLMGLDSKMSSEQMTVFIAIIQLGTLAAVLVYFLGDIISITSGFIGGNLVKLRDRHSKTMSNSARLGWLIIIGSLPIATVGLAAKRIIEGPLTKNLYIIAGSMILWAILLGLAEFFGERRRGMTELTVKDAIIVGLAQVFALLPGSSRSGTTMTGALFSGLSRETAARFSFLLSIPAIGASGLLELKEAMEIGFEGIGTTNLVVATIVSAVVGYASIAFLLSFLRKHTTYVFIGYRVILGGIILALLFMGRVMPI
ncbi:MAG TPA: undecaprenyl-diphosphatase UppP [Blastocatellia bacterium]|nr:undecaprenyl-diphosphatase UppP [Blastocatellia bacterium]